MGVEINCRAAYFCAAVEVRRRWRLGQPLPRWLRDHYAELDRTVRDVSRSRHESGEKPDDPPELLSTVEAAAILGISTRQVQRRRDQLGGRKIGNQLVFGRSNIERWRDGHPG